MEVLVVLVAWYINALMDAIDHGKGSKSLYELWHLLKAISYGVLIAYVLYGQPFLVIISTFILMYVWELIYGYSRKKDLWIYDDIFKCKYIAWIWKIRRG